MQSSIPMTVLQSVNHESSSHEVEFSPGCPPKLLFIQGRSAQWTRDGLSYTLQEGHMAYLRGNLAPEEFVTSITLAKNTRALIIPLPLDVSHYFDTHNSTKDTIYPILPPVSEVIHILVSGTAFTGLAGSMYIQGKILELLALCLHCLGCPLRTATHMTGRDAQLVRQAQDLIKGDLANVPSLDTMAQALGTNGNRLTLCFKNVMGCTPWDFVMEERLLMSQSLLTNTQVPIGEIAERTGYTSQAHFSSFFRRATGLSPRDYRKALGIPTT